MNKSFSETKVQVWMTADEFVEYYAWKKEKEFKGELSESTKIAVKLNF